MNDMENVSQLFLNEQKELILKVYFSKLKKSFVMQSGKV